VDKNKILLLKTTFDETSHKLNDGIEYWLARELQVLLGYTKWDNFKDVIENAKEACSNSKVPIDNHFADVGKMVNAGVAPKEIGDIRYTH